MSRHRYRNSEPSFCKVFVGNLGDSGNEQELEDAFNYYGPLISVWVARNPPGFAFIEFADPNDALDAVSCLDGAFLCGRHVKVEIARSNSRSSNRPPSSPERCYACGERGHYARDCILQYIDDVDSENEIDYSSFGEGFGSYSELLVDPETYDSVDWNAVIQSMGILPRTHNQRNRHNSSSSNNYQELSNEYRNIPQLQHRSNRSRQSDWFDSLPQQVLVDSHPQRRRDRPQQTNWVDNPPQQRRNRHRQTYWNGSPPQQRRNRPQQTYWNDSPPQQRRDRPLQHSRPRQTNWDDSLPQQSMSNRSTQWNWGPQRNWGDTPPQGNRGDTPPQWNLGPQWNWGDTPPQGNQGDTLPQGNQGDTLPQGNQGDTPLQWNQGDRPSQQNRRGRSQQLPGNPSNSSVSSKHNNTTDDIKCAICLDTEDNSEMEYIRCGHGFHAKCCHNWLSINSICPVCRTSVTPQNSNGQGNAAMTVHFARARSLRFPLASQNSNGQGNAAMTVHFARARARVLRFPLA